MFVAKLKIKNNLLFLTFYFLFDKECASYYCEQGNTLYEGCGKKHGGKDLTIGFGLTSDSVHCVATNLADTETCTDSSHTCAESATKLSETFCC